MSPNIAVRTSSFSAAIEFYSHFLGFPDCSSDPDLVDLDAAPLNMYIIKDNAISGPVKELFIGPWKKLGMNSSPTAVKLYAGGAKASTAISRIRLG